ncbi:Domain of unknown function DUF1836 [Desulfotomaculum nigrificans CO-1-SRB]|uniref:DUF1836 domain-containing protein n=1 Tax=Desulfotomaculum nigrificans (strain DSM 14880 / VKM B-2319 / CO-1-SRB) TaxID=868595 RepID=F6B7L9_DESCC|nr:DUF1836 domain-containing protein [Desulfotomaculum nigrificans]AEF94573.1 Domain of unknown function DUF1836 [Desulfotomaculum nigrificans CO-1-SRB]
MEERGHDLKKLIEELDLADDIDLSDIPDMELYMEQLLTFFDKKLGHLKRDNTDKIFTKTMINNYTKGGLLPPPQNKKYGKEHIILLILVYNLKNILSFNDIGTLFAPVLKNIEQSDDDIVSLEDIYSTLVDLKRYEFADFRQTFNEKFKLISDKTLSIQNKQEQELAQLFLTVIMLVAQANAAKRMAEQIIDKYFKG